MHLGKNRGIFGVVNYTQGFVKPKNEIYAFYAWFLVYKFGQECKLQELLFLLKIKARENLPKRSVLEKESYLYMLEILKIYIFVMITCILREKPFRLTH